MTLELNVFNAGNQMGDDEEVHEVNLIEEVVQEHVDSILYKDPLELCLISQEGSHVESEEVKFLKDLCTVKRKLNVNKKVLLT